MKVTIERFERGGPGAPSAAARYYVIVDQPSGNTAGLVTGSYNTSWQTSLANAVTYIQGLTEISGP